MKTQEDNIDEWNYVVVLHRYYIWGNRMRTHFDQVIKAKKTDVHGKKMGMSIEEFMYMSLWYAVLYVVIEGWRQLRLKDECIDRLLQSKNVALLKRYRNGVFHYQKEYIDERFLGFIRDGEDCVNWVRDLNSEFGRFFLTYFRSIKGK